MSSRIPRERRDRPTAEEVRLGLCMGALGGGLLLFEVLLTRVLSVALFGALAFAVIALALVGLAAGGWLAARHEHLPVSERRERSAAALLLAGVSGLLAIAFLAWVPLVPESIQGQPKTTQEHPEST